MNGKQLRNSILQWAIQGKLVPQDSNDEPASVLLDKIRKEKEHLVREGRLKKDKQESIIYRGEDGKYYERIGKTIKCIDEEIPFEIPDSWEWCRLSNLCTIFGRIGYRGYTTEDIVDSGNGAITISPSNMMINGSMNFHKVTYISWNKYHESPEIKVRRGDILVVKTGSSYGKTSYVDTLPEKSTINPQIAILKFIFAKKLWLTRILNSPFCQSQFEKYVIGTSIPTFSQEKLSSTLIPLPPLNEQQRIVKKLEELLPLIDRYEKAQEGLDKIHAEIKEKLKASILQEAIQGKLVPQDSNDEPAIDLLKRIDSKTQPITKEIPFEIPKSWCWVRLGEIAKSRIGKTPARNESLYWMDGIHNWVSIADMEEYGVINKTKEKLSSASEIIMGKKSPIGTLIMSFKLTVGRTSILQVPAYHNEAIISIYPIVDDNYAMRNYLFYVLPLISNWGESKDAIKGRTLNSKSIYNLLIPLPPLAEQQRIIEKLKLLFTQLDKMNNIQP